MPFRYIVGPVTISWASEYLQSQIDLEECRTFGISEPGIIVGADEGWDALIRQLPGWEAEALVLSSHYCSLSSKLFAAPVPIVALAADWNLQWHSYRGLLKLCDLVLTDTQGVNRLSQEGVANVQAANLFGIGSSWLADSWTAVNRDIDVLFVGNYHPDVQKDRLSCLGKLASLRPRWNVVQATAVFGEEYRRLMGRARIVFNRGIRGEWNLRAGEAIAAGALLFQEAGNREVPQLLRDREECVLYEDHNLLSLIRYYLEHEDERAAIAAKARTRLPEFSFAALWGRQIGAIQEMMPELRERAANRVARAEKLDLGTRIWCALSASHPSDRNLPADIAALIETQPDDASLHHAAGKMALGDNSTPLPQRWIEAANAFQQACRCDPTHIVAQLNLAEMLVRMRQRDNAVEQCERTLGLLDHVAEQDLHGWDAAHAGDGFDAMRVEWERAAWANAGDRGDEVRAKAVLVRWRLHRMLADLQEDLVHAFTAAALRPDLPGGVSSLGCALARKGRLREAAWFLRQALAVNPFDQTAARALYEALRLAGNGRQAEAWAMQRRLLSASAPKIVPEESWFAETNLSANPAPNGTELTSLLILCCNQLPYTRLCIESVLRHTRAPYELILVDNGSTDDTPSYLESLRSRSGPERVEIIRNETNLGFAKGCNQALAQAHGKYLVLLNNDTVVTAQWLDGLIAWSLHDWPKVGMVGPVTNYAAEPQQIPVPYTKLEDLDTFAEQRGREFARQAMQYPRLTGFCLLIRREVLDAMGELDERFGTGFFEDDDLCIRAKEAGFSLLIALNVYVHHFGSRTFADLGIDCEKQLRENFELFREKWGDAHAAGYRLPGDAAPLVHPRSLTPSAIAATLTLAERYEQVCRIPSDINEHCPTLAALTRECQHITEFGTRGGVSTTAFLHSQPERLVAYDRVRQPAVSELRALAGRTKFLFCEADVLQIEIEPTDLLFIDTLHDYDQLKEELRLHGGKARKYVVLHDTTTFGEHGETPGRVGIWPAIEEFLRLGTFRVKERFHHNNGLTILERVAQGKYQAETMPTNLSSAARPTISLTMIVKNEEANLGACLDSVADLVNEIIVVDTGSTDRTKEIARRFGAKLFDFPWIDHFAAARNEALRHATGEWVFWMDADDRVDAENRRKLRELFTNLPTENLGFVMKCLCLPDADSGTSTVVDHVRLFRNHPQVRWTYRIHEQILPSIRKLGGDVRWSEVTIHHVGYQDRSVRAKKLERDLRLLSLEHQDQPDDPFTNFNLASVFQEQGKVREALELFRRSLDRSASTDSIVRKLYAQIIQCERLLKQASDALKTCEEARRHYPHDLEILFQEALTKRDLGDRRGAIACLERVLEQRDTPHFASVDTGLRGYKTRHNLAVFLQEEGSREEAEKQWTLALDEQPTFVPALAGLAEIALSRQDWPQFDPLVARLAQSRNGDLDAQTLQARKHLARREFTDARQAIERTVGTHPRAVWPRVVLTHVLLQEGKDWAAAERALRDVLMLNPDHEEAKSNLDILLQQQVNDKR